jgi:hypothetical protein
MANFITYFMQSFGFRWNMGISENKSNIRRQIKTNFWVQIFIPLYIFQCLKSSISIGENWCHTNTKTCFTTIFSQSCVFVLVCHRFSPILILLFNHFGKFGGYEIFHRKIHLIFSSMAKNKIFKCSFNPLVVIKCNI